MDCRYNLQPSKENFKKLSKASPVFLMEMAINKRVRNDFKDRVKSFFGEIVKPCYKLKAVDKELRKAAVQKHLKRLNVWLHKKRNFTDTPTSEARKLNHGVVIPFQKDPKSSMIVRVLRTEVKCFETKERAPYLFIVETIE